ncbi:MAG: mechanosensitive ion channel family protein [Chloroflexota bacterium]|nr:mechanosensitive ion channel family protein [Chloroflexota bacterium]
MPEFNFDDVNLNFLVTAGLQILLILFVAFVVSLFLKYTIPKVVERRIQTIMHDQPVEEVVKRKNTVADAINWVVRLVIFIIAFIMILSVAGIDTAPLVAGVGLLGLGVGFAAQKIIRDYLNGLFILTEDWYRVEEVATIAGVTGMVVELNLRRTILRDLDGTMHIIPNSNIEMASNMARQWARINLNVTVAYKEDINRVWQMVNELCNEFKNDATWGQHMLTTPAVVRVDKLGDHGVDIKILGDTKAGQQWALMGELRKRIKERFDQENVEIPWPHAKVYFGDGAEILDKPKQLRSK